MTSQLQMGDHRVYGILVCLIATYIQLSQFAHSESTNCKYESEKFVNLKRRIEIE